jgi:hypothetical protein
MKKFQTFLSLLFVAFLQVSPTCQAADPRINEFMAANANTLLDSFGVSSDWIEIYNPGPSNLNLQGWYLTDDADSLTEWAFPDVTIPALDYLVVFASGMDTNVGAELHTSFQLKSDGEYLALVASGGVTVVHEFSPEYPQQFADISYGLGPLDDARFFTNATPGSANAVGAEEFVADTKYDPDRGYYTNAVTVTISTATTGATIYVTTDFTRPTTNSTVYTGPMTLTNTTCLRAMAFRDGLYPSDADTQTYIFIDDVLNQPNDPATFPSSWAGTTAEYGMNPTIVTDPQYADRMHDALLSIPSISIVTETENLFDASTGAYTHPGGVGFAWERPISFEWMNPEDPKGVQINAGLRIYGGAFRSFGLTRKKSFRLLFKAEYGETKLKADLFDGKNAVNSFDTLVLRAGANDGWNSWGNVNVQYVTDEVMRRTQIAFGQPASHGTFAHVYLNGLYWGMYNLVERPDASFSGSYFGGTEEDWDGLNAGFPIGESNTGTKDAMLAQIRSGMTDNTSYQKIQGLNLDGTVNPAFDDLMDIDNYIDYMLVNFWGGTGDWPGHNYYAGCHRTPASTGFKSYIWDSEAALSTWSSLTTDNTGVNNGWGEPYGAMRQNAEFRLRFADHVQKQLFDDGEATPHVVSNRYLEVTTMIEDAIIAESARWGNSSGILRTPATWEAKRNYVQNTYIPQRTAIAISNLQGAFLFPTVAAPGFSQNGGTFTNGFTLTMTSPEDIYYTLDGTDPREFGTSLAVGTLYASPISLTYAVHVKARAKDISGTWSALREATFSPDDPNPLRLTELMYHPRPPAGAELIAAESAGDFEFIEFQNQGSDILGLVGLSIDGGITFNFSKGVILTLAPNDFVIIVRNLDAFKVRYPNWATMNIAGEYQTFDSFPIKTLSDSGESISLEDATGSNIVKFTYNDARDWPQSTDGAGHALVPSESIDQPAGDLDYSGHWRASAFIDGSPGSADPFLSQTVVLNEILAHTDFADVAFPDYDSNDGIELFNTADSTISLANWYLSDDASTLTKWAIPAHLSIASNDWRWFSEVLDFHAPITNGFGLDKAGEVLFLSHLPGGVSNRVVDAYQFKGQPNNVSMGRYPDGASDWFALVPTTNSANGMPTMSIIISELMYNPASTQALNNTVAEYIELSNPTDQSVNLWTDAGTWRIDGGIDYTFPTNVTMDPAQYILIVSFDPDLDTAELQEFLTTYALTNGQARLFGPYRGQLDNHTERVTLEKPQEADAPSTRISWIIVDEVVYLDRQPWPSGTDGTGAPLQRLVAPNSGLSSTSWYNGFVGTPGVPGTPLAIVTPVHGSRYFAPAIEPISIAFDAQQVTGVVQQITYLDGTNVICVATQAPYTCSIDMPEARPYQINAHLYHDGGVITARQSVVNALEPQIQTALDITEETATLRGDLKGGANATLAFYYGLSDGGTDPGAWDTVVFLAGGPTTGPVDFDVSDLSPSSTYYTRMQASADGHSGWSTGVTSFATLTFADWSHTMEIAFSGAGNTTLTNFPVLIKLHTGLTGFDYDQFASPLGNDLRFSGSHIGQRLAYEIEQWDPAGTSYVWVAVHELNSNSTIHAHWGLVTATNGPPLYTQDGSTWDSPFASVWHMGPSLDDATHAYPGTVPNGAVATPGIVGTAQHFDGNGASFTNGPNASWYANHMDGMTLSFWLRPSAGISTASTVFGVTGETGRNFFVDINTYPNVRRWRVGLDDAVPRPIELYQIGNWQYLAVVLQPGEVWSALNGSSLSFAATNQPFTPAGPLTTGGRASPGLFFKGEIDEMRIVDRPLSEEWLRAEYETVAQHASFTQYAPVQSAPSDPDVDSDGLPDAWENRFPQGMAIEPDAHDDNDGLSNKDEYVAGTDPTNSASVFFLGLGMSNSSPMLRLFALEATGAGYEGLERLYALEFVPSLSETNWIGLPGMTNIIGRDEWIIHTNLPPGQHPVFRARTRLSPLPNN